jgi:glycosyltransferase involved in cell wall biosynthesis
VKILLTFDWFLKLVVEGQAKALHDLGHEVWLLCRESASEFDGNAVERRQTLQPLIDRGIRVIGLPGRRFGPEGLPATVRARQIIREWAPDVVSVHDNADPRLWAGASGAPIVYTVHDPVPHPGAVPLNVPERIGRALWMRSADAFVVHGEGLVDELRPQVGDRPIRVVPLGIDVAEHALPVPPQPTILLFGRLEAYKGISVLAEAMSDVWLVRPDVRLLVAGRGPAASEVPSDSRVEFIEGYVPEDHVPGLLSRATVAVLPYTQASQSGVGLLALARGIPTVVTDVGALAELAVDPHHLARAGEPADLAARLIHALEADPEMRSSVLEFARRRFSWRSVAESYVVVYREAVGSALVA